MVISTLRSFLFPIIDSIQFFDRMSFMTSLSRDHSFQEMVCQLPLNKSYLQPYHTSLVSLLNVLKSYIKKESSLVKKFIRLFESKQPIFCTITKAVKFGEERRIIF